MSVHIPQEKLFPLRGVQFSCGFAVSSITKSLHLQSHYKEDLQSTNRA
jgi:hypothetical protein